MTVHRSVKWSIVKLGSLLSVLTDYHANGSYKSLKTNVELLSEPDYAIMIRTTNFERNDFDDNLRYVSEKAYDFLKKTKVRTGDILMNKIANAGSVYYMPYLARPVSLGMNLFLLRTNPELTNQRFIYYALKANESYTKSFAVGTAAKTIHKKSVRNLAVSLPPLEEQEKIANILSAYDDLIEKNTARIAILEEMANTIFKEWFVHLRYPGYKENEVVETPDGLTPKNWEWRNLFEVANITFGEALKSEYFNEESEGFPIVRIRDIPNNFTSTFTTESIDEKYFVKNGDILVGMDGDFHMCRWAGGDAYLVQRVARFRPKDSTSPYFLFWCLRAHVEYLNATITGTTVAHLGKKHLERLKILVPDERTAEKVNRTFDPLYDEEINLRTINLRLKEMRDMLLPRLVSGKLSVASSD